MNVTGTHVNGYQAIDLLNSQEVSSSKEVLNTQTKAILESDVVSFSMAGLRKLALDNVTFEPNGSGGGDGIEPPKALGSGGGDGIEPPKALGSGGGDGIEPPKTLGSGGGDGIEPPK